MNFDRNNWKVWNSNDTMHWMNTDIFQHIFMQLRIFKVQESHLRLFSETFKRICQQQKVSLSYFLTKDEKRDIVYANLVAYGRAFKDIYDNVAKDLKMGQNEKPNEEQRKTVLEKTFYDVFQQKIKELKNRRVSKRNLGPKHANRNSIQEDRKSSSICSESWRCYE